MPSSSEDAHTQDVICRQENRAGLVILSRPKALNALSLDMIRDMERHFHGWAKDPHVYGVVQRSQDDGVFCAGADVKALYDLRERDKTPGIALFREEYQHNWTLQRFIKPTVSLMNGIVMGGGVGISVHGTHRVAGAGYKFAMPETAIGLFPDIGATHFLSQLPGRIGLYLGLTGTVIGPADGYHLALATHCIDVERFDEIQTAVSEAEPIDPLLDAMHQDPGDSELAALRPAIDRCFAPADISEIIERLEDETGEFSAWARDTAQTLRARSPTSLKLTLRLYEEGTRLANLKDALKLEFRCAVRSLYRHDHYEGVRAKMIDRDDHPQWQPARLEDVSDATIDAYLAPLEAIPELELHDHWTLVD